MSEDGKSNVMCVIVCIILFPMSDEVLIKKILFVLRRKEKMTAVV